MNRREFLKRFTISCGALSAIENSVHAQVYTNTGNANVQNNSSEFVKTYQNTALQNSEKFASDSSLSESERFKIMQTQQQVQTLLWVRRGKDEFQLDYTGEKGSRMVAWLLRDISANRQGIPDIRLLHTMSWIQTWLALHGHHVCYELLSGLRMPSTNNSIEGAARGSFHLPDKHGVFRAVDLRARPIPSAYIGKLAYLLKQGGVGFYSRDFTHIDTGTLIGKQGTQRIWYHR